MNVKIIKQILFLALIFSSYSFSQANWQDGLEYGNYSVGFEVIYAKDFSRNYLSIGDSAFNPRPMQIGIWYPAEKEAKGIELNFGYYLLLENSEESLNVKDMEDVRKSKEKYSKFVKGNNIETVFNELQYSKLDVPRLTGNFPLIIYASSQGSSGYENHLICEQLASHGFIVVTTASKGAYSRAMPFNEEGAEAQVRDLEFLYGFMHNYPHVNIESVGAIGFSFGGLNMVTFSLKNLNIKCLVSLDGSIFSPLGVSIIESYRYLNIENLNSTFLGFLGDKSEFKNSLIYDKVDLIDVYLLKLKYHNHLDFSSSNLIFNNRPDSIKMWYVDMANLTLSFINKHLKDNSSFDKVIKDYPKPFYKYFKQKISKGEPEIRKEGYIRYFEENGIDKGLQIYSETKKNFPDYLLFDYDSFRDIGFLMMMNKDYKNAIRVFEVLLAEYPANPDSYRRLGEAYMEDGNLEKASEFIEKGLILEPNSPAMKDILRIINERSKK